MVYTCSMVQVYLPMGYPQQSGQQFANVIYQGNVVRLYTVPKDPRSDAQLDQRRFLSDITKMRSMLGVFGKAAMSSALGSKWGTVVYQAIKADMENWWSDALAEWNNFTEGNQEAWRTAAPYKACFNDLGMIYYGLTRVMYRAALSWSSHHWEMEEWGEAESAGAVAWWARDLTGVLTSKLIDSDSALITYHDGGTRVLNASFIGGSFYKDIGYFEFYFKAKHFTLMAVNGPDHGTIKIYLDGVVKFEHDLTDSILRNIYNPTIDFDRKGLHFLRVEGGAIDFIGLS